MAATLSPVLRVPPSQLTQLLFVHRAREPGGAIAIFAIDFKKIFDVWQTIARIVEMGNRFPIFTIEVLKVF